MMLFWGIEFSHLRCDVDGAHQHLVQVPVRHEAGAVDQSVLKAGPDLEAQLVADVQYGAQLSETLAHQLVDLRLKHGERTG